MHLIGANNIGVGLNALGEGQMVTNNIALGQLAIGTGVLQVEMTILESRADGRCITSGACNICNRNRCMELHPLW